MSRTTLKSRKRQSPIHPGEILQLEFLEPLGITKYRLAKETGMPADRVSRLVKGKRDFSGDTALRLARYFGTTAEFWMNLQAKFDIDTAVEISGARIAKQVKPFKQSQPPKAA
ncbi:transcriptional regulator [Phycisphaerae bacterium]|nr:transcriptional regulator [Phycisphaerae bacterium]